MIRKCLPSSALPMGRGPIQAPKETSTRGATPQEAPAGTHGPRSSRNANSDIPAIGAGQTPSHPQPVAASPAATLAARATKSSPGEEEEEERRRRTAAEEDKAREMMTHLCFSITEPRPPSRPLRCSSDQHCILEYRVIFRHGDEPHLSFIVCH